MPPVNITEEGVRRRLEKLKPHKAAGPDSLKPLVLKQLAESIAPVVTIGFTGHHCAKARPQTLGRKPISHVFKKGEKYKAINYRPVFLTCILRKQMEQILSSHIMKHLNTNHLLYDKQHGFRSKLSCETQLIEFTSDVLNSKTVKDGSNAW